MALVDRSCTATEIVAQLDIPIVAVDEVATVTYWNRPAEHVLGYSAVEALGRPVGDVLGSPFAEQPMHVGPDEEVPCLRKGGSSVPVSVRCTPIGGERAGFILVVCERTKTEQQLRKSQERLRMAHDVAQVSFWEWDPRSESVEWTSDFGAKYGFAPVLEGQESWRSRIHPDDLPRIDAARDQAVAEHRTFEVIFRMVVPGSTQRWVRAFGGATYDDQGQPIRVYGIAVDVTDRKELEEARRDADRKGEFLAMLSHELRNPLTPIKNSLAVLERALPGGDQAKHAQAVIGRQVGHLTRIVDDLLDVTRITRGKVQLHHERIEFGDLARRTAEDHRVAFADRGIHFDSRLSTEPMWVDADATRIAQIIGNLLGNACKFASRGGHVGMTLERRGASAVLRVRDDGVGIVPEVRDHLFQPFAQAAQTLDRSRGGLGLGLALVKGFVELHGGVVGVESEGPGRGAEFTVRIPVETAPCEAVSEAAPAHPRHRRILVIEDNIDAAETLKELLELVGHEVQVANDGAVGLSVAHAFRPEVVLCDIGLPGMSGYQVAEAFRADPTLRDAVLVALTGYALPEDRKRAASAGFAHHVAKPPSLGELDRVIEGAP